MLERIVIGDSIRVTDGEAYKAVGRAIISCYLVRIKSEIRLTLSEFNTTVFGPGFEILARCDSYVSY